MGVAAIILGVLGLVGIGIGLPLLKAYLLFGGMACSLAALIVGLIGKQDGASARAGMVLGLVGVIGSCPGGSNSRSPRRATNERPL